MKLYARIPARFFDERAGLGFPTPSVVARRGHIVKVYADDPALKDLLHEARRTARSIDGPEDVPRGLKASARRTVTAIKRAFEEKAP